MTQRTPSGRADHILADFSELILYCRSRACRRQSERSSWLSEGKARHDKAIAIRLLLKDQTGAAPEKVCKRMQMFETFDVMTSS